MVSESPKRLARFKALQDNQSQSQAIGLIQDVATRWNSTFNMLVRARRLKITIEQWIDVDRKYIQLQLTQDEWRQIDEAILFLKPFSDYTHDVSSAKNATIHNAFFIYNDIFDHIAKQRKRVWKLPRAAWIQGLLDATRSSRVVLQKYYSKTTHRGFIYNIATILNPSKKLALYEDWGNVRIQDPSQIGASDTVSYTEFYR